MLVVLPAPGPGLLLQVLPVVLLSGSAVPHLPLDPHGVVTGNRVFVFGTFKKATLQRMKQSYDQLFILDAKYKEDREMRQRSPKHQRALLKEWSSRRFCDPKHVSQELCCRKRHGGGQDRRS